MTTGMQTSRVFMNGRSQAVRIPAQYRFNDNEVFVNKIGDTLMITPIEKLAESLERGAAMIPDDFMEDGIPDEIPVKREEL
jgi:antitoxin VapB